MSQEGIKHIQKQYDKFVKDNHPAAKHAKKILDNPTNKTNVLKNGIHMSCYECSHDPADPGGSHPKKCTIKKCPFYNFRPGAGKDSDVPKKEVSPERKAKLQDVAAKAREGRKAKMKISEVMEIIECKCKDKKKKKDGEEDCGCKCKGKCDCSDK